MENQQVGDSSPHLGPRDCPQHRREEPPQYELFLTRYLCYTRAHQHGEPKGQTMF